MQFRRDFESDAAEVFVCDESEQAIAGADLAGGEIERGEGPAVGEHFFRPEAEAGCAGIAAAIGFESASNSVFEAGGIDVEVLDDVVEVVVLLVEELGEKMFEFDVVVRAGEAKATGVFEGFAGGFVGFCR